jgi:hypothetical protein
MFTTSNSCNPCLFVVFYSVQMHVENRLVGIKSIFISQRVFSPRYSYPLIRFFRLETKFQLLPA